MRRGEIVKRGLYGHAKIPGWAVVRRSRKHRDVLTLRHAWKDDEDARVWSAVRHAFMHEARILATKLGTYVEVYNYWGDLIEEVHP